NSGIIRGQMRGNLLIADYSFSSEGFPSSRPVAFKKVGEDFVEGFGETEGKNGYFVFKNADSLDFTHSFALHPFECGN
ncbi:MAG: hypothetical protein ABJA85_06400, partial [Bacteroidota bacterium]